MQQPIIKMCVIFIFVMMSRYHASAKIINVSLVIKCGYGQQGKRGLAKLKQTLHCRRIYFQILTCNRSLDSSSDSRSGYKLLFSSSIYHNIYIGVRTPASERL